MKTTFAVMVLTSGAALAALIAWPEWFGPLEMAVLLLFSAAVCVFICAARNNGLDRLAQQRSVIVD